MLRGLPHLCKYMPKPKDARRLIPDPENEPDFYRISKMYPLPDDPAFGKEKTKEQEAPTRREVPVASVAAVASASPVGAAVKRSAPDLNWMNSQVQDSKRMRGMQPDPLMSLAASASLNNPPPPLTGVNWQIPAAPVSNLHAALDQNAVLAALAAGYGAPPRGLADLYPSVNGSQHAQNLFNAFRHL